MTEETSFDEGFALMFSEKNDQPKEKAVDEDNSILKHILESQKMYDITNTFHEGEIPPNRFDPALLVRHIVGNWGINNLVGVQPMTGPLGMAYALEYNIQEMGGEQYDGDEAPDQNVRQRMSLDVVTHTLEAGMRKLKTAYTVEAVADMRSYYKLDLDTEMAQMAGDEIAKEVCAEVLGDLMDCGHKHTSDAKDQVDHIRIAINVQSNAIGQESRRGSATWIVVGLNVLARLIGNETFVRSMDPNDKHDGSALRYVGTLNGSQKVFYSSYVPYNEVLCGYKGSSDVDTGYIYSPYVMILQRGPAVDPETFETTLTISTRYAKKSLHKTLTETIRDDEKREITTTTNLENSHYRTITFSNISEQAEAISEEAVSLLLSKINNNEPLPEPEPTPSFAELLAKMLKDNPNEVGIMSDLSFFISSIISEGDIKEEKLNLMIDEALEELSTRHEMDDILIKLIGMFIIEQVAPFIIDQEDEE